MGEQGIDDAAFTPIRAGDPLMARGKIEKEIRLLKAYAVGSTLCFAVLFFAGFRGGVGKQRFTEIEVERINIVEADGTLRLVLSNRDRSPGPVLRGQPFAYPGGTRPGLIFYNDEGTENGGLIFGGRRNPDGTFQADHSLTFDQYEQDQIIALQYTDNNGDRRQGLQIMDRSERPITEMLESMTAIEQMPDGPEKLAAMQQFQSDHWNAQRLYVGRNRNKAATVLMGDRQGRTRLRMVVDSTGNASIDFLDEAGKVTYRLPEALENASASAVRPR